MTPSTDKSVIFTADDFGLADALNGAVVLAHRQGLLACASLMAAGPRTQAALSLARDSPRSLPGGPPHPDPGAGRPAA